MNAQAIDAATALRWNEMLNDHLAAVLHNVNAQAAIDAADRELEEYGQHEDAQGRCLGDPGYDWEWSNAMAGLAKANRALAPTLDGRILSRNEVAELLRRLS